MPFVTKKIYFGGDGASFSSTYDSSGAGPSSAYTPLQRDSWSDDVFSSPIVAVPEPPALPARMPEKEIDIDALVAAMTRCTISKA